MSAPAFTIEFGNWTAEDGKTYPVVMSKGGTRPFVEMTAAPTPAEKAGWAVAAALELFSQWRYGRFDWVPRRMAEIKKGARLKAGTMANPRYDPADQTQSPPAPMTVAVTLRVFDHSDGSVSASLFWAADQIDDSSPAVRLAAVANALVNG